MCLKLACNDWIFIAVTKYLVNFNWILVDNFIWKIHFYSVNAQSSHKCIFKQLIAAETVSAGRVVIELIRLFRIF